MAMSRKVHTWLTGLRFALRSVLGRSPAVYFGIQRLRPSRRHLLVKKDTEIVIEGYPRSANTFAVAAFLLAQGRAVKIAHHLHVPAQVIQAVRWGIPHCIDSRSTRCCPLFAGKRTLSERKASIAGLHYLLQYNISLS